MHLVHRAFVASLTIGLVGALSSSAHAESNTLSLSPSAVTVNVAWDGSVTGTRTVTAAVSHSDGGTFCDKIYQVEIRNTVSNATLGAYVLPNALCSFNTNDVSIPIQPFTDAEMVNICAVQGPGTRTIANRVIGVALYPNMSIIGFQSNNSIRDTQTATATIFCAGPPPPAAQTPTPGPTSGGTVGTPPVVTSTPPPATFDPKTAARPVVATQRVSGSALTVAQLKAQASKQTVKINPDAILYTMTVTVPATDKAAVDAAKTKLDTDYLAYQTAAQTYATAYTTCLNKPLTVADYNVCDDADTDKVCMRKIFARCMAPAVSAVEAARVPLRSDAVRLRAAADALSGI